MAKMIASSLFLLLGALSFIAMIQGQDQSGFISIDCGLPDNSIYTEKNTGINYISDANFIDSGVSKTVSPQDKTTDQQYFDYLRSFPNGIRNCYSINVTSVKRYLIRASFLYGNYDGLNKLPEFDLYLGVHFWETVKFTDSSVSINYELIHTLSLDYIQICLVNKGTGTPFISVIEMRILGNVATSYVTIESSTSLARFQRLYFSSFTNLIYRYQYDPYDRIWEPYWDDKWRLISSNYSNQALDQDSFIPPAVVLETAATSINDTASLEFHWDNDDNKTQHQYYFYLYLTELQQLGADQTRSFNINMDGETWNTLESLQYGKVYTKHVRGLSSGCKKCRISLIRTESSTLPPIISALEIYLAKNFSSQSETNKDAEFGKQQLNRFGFKRTPSKTK
ncbi:probable LRR receptor-like serine/threonine-protein kinase At1g05700 [Arachis duranensis]|uniref:Probable LRR receptor-like serine/threonine-protein kinase At1g05700 n=1 Tax=Arachis duranensis TaxID=130453 RepID=A0A9C6TGE7_ARADU|nr:probable LRR receptor-like serine/threonine-protein kinase At1g05700 [Arachis duranensis]